MRTIESFFKSGKPTNRFTAQEIEAIGEPISSDEALQTMERFAETSRNMGISIADMGVEDKTVCC